MISIPPILLYIIIALIIFLIIMITYLINTLKSEKKLNSLQTQRLDNLSSKVDELKLENYDAKLNPHLFKNILNSIQSNAYQTYYTIDKLANVLDYILYESKANFVTVKDEIYFTKNFIEINKVKVSPLFDFQIKTKIDELLEEGYDPKLDDGVGKNIAPLQKKNMNSYDVLNAGQLKKYLNADW